MDFGTAGTFMDKEAVYKSAKMKVLTIKDFKEFSFDKKCDVVTIYSNYITYRDLPQGKAYLYHTGSFYIEVIYSSVQKKILLINAFNDQKQLEPYAETISLADLNV
ncbi:MAG: hypothetical protein AB7O48_09320 [Cyclobacteriaceae bacterium]